jgi:hypothetical protein
MRIASIIYLLTALAYACWDIQLCLSEGAHLGSIIMVIFVAALLVLANGLFRGKPHARFGAMLVSLGLTLAFGYMAFGLVYPPGGLTFAVRMEIFGPFFVLLVSVAVAHAVAIALLMVAPPVNPSSSLKATVMDRREIPAPRAAR